MENNKFLTGSNGFLWFGGELLAELSKVDIKVEGNFEDVTCAGDFATYPHYNGYSVSGSIGIHKINTKIQAKYAEAFRKGVMPDLTIVSKLTNAATGQSERTSVTGVVITSFPLAGFEAQKQVDEEYPLKASHYEILEEIV